MDENTKIPSNPRRRPKSKLQIFKEVYLPAIIAGLTLLLIIIFIIGALVQRGKKDEPASNSSETPSQSSSAPDPTETAALQTPAFTGTDAEQIIQAYAYAHDLSLSDYPEAMIELLEKNPEAEQFVLEWPIREQYLSQAVDLSGYSNTDGVPLFIQWDQQWGYYPYGSDVIGDVGCGPTTLAMVGYYFTGDSSFNPIDVAKFAMDNQYYLEGSGTRWSLFTDGAQALGLNSTEIPLVESQMRKYLEEGKLIVCIMGPGAFTNEGHFILLTGVEDGKFRINDCNSYINSEKLWSYEEFQDQVRNLWVLSK